MFKFRQNRKSLKETELFKCTGTLRVPGHGNETVTGKMYTVVLCKYGDDTYKILGRNQMDDLLFEIVLNTVKNYFIFDRTSHAITTSDGRKVILSLNDGDDCECFYSTLKGILKLLRKYQKPSSPLKRRTISEREASEGPSRPVQKEVVRPQSNIEGKYVSEVSYDTVNLEKPIDVSKSSTEENVFDPYLSDERWKCRNCSLPNSSRLGHCQGCAQPNPDRRFDQIWDTHDQNLEDTAPCDATYMTMTPSPFPLAVPPVGVKLDVKDRIAEASYMMLIPAPTTPRPPTLPPRAPRVRILSLQPATLESSVKDNEEIKIYHNEPSTPQMVDKVDDGQWSCHHCTLENPANASRCEVCGGLRIDLPTETKTPTSQDVLPPRPTAEKEKSSAISDLTTQMFGLSSADVLREDNWSCTQCTFDNQATSKVCEACGNVRIEGTEEIVLSDHWMCSFCSLENGSNNMQCSACRAWICSLCTAHNQPGELVCSVCNIERC